MRPSSKSHLAAADGGVIVMPQVYDSIVIGAGPSGLLAAVTLKDAGADILVLEARDRIGGRAYTDSLSDGTAYERGAQQVHGPSIATWEFISKFGLKTHGIASWTDGAPTFVGGKWLPNGDPIGDEAYGLMDEVLGKPNPDSVSVHEALVAAGLEGALLEAGEAMLRNSAPVDPEEMSARNAADIWHLGDSPRDPISGVSRPGNQNFHLVDGYRSLWRELSKPIQDSIRLRTPVTGISWSSHGVVITGGGSQFKARTAVLTLPIGVLQQNRIEFDPPLPAPKVNAIENIMSGGMIKVVIEFQSAFWEDTVGRVPYFHNPPSSPFRLFLSLFWNRPGPPTLNTSVGYPYAQEVTGDPDRVRSMLFDTLGEMFPDVDLESELVGLHIADWPSDPWTMGVQSCVPVGGHQLRADLAAPTPPLFWAGEATHTRGLAACVHGSLETGRRAAFEAMHSLRPLLAADPDSRLNWPQ